MGPKIFTVREANQLIPSLDARFREIDGVRERLRRIKNKIDVLEMIWGDEIHSETNPDRREHLHYMSEVEQIKKEFDAAARGFTELEVLIKSIEAGLVDFYGVVDGRLVFLCWKRGESAVQWYHHVEEGFSGRIPLPVAELAQ